MAFIAIPVGFVRAQGHAAVIVSQQAIACLARYEITPSDLYKPINDTTNSAVMAGRLIVGGGIYHTIEGGTCGMHVAELASNHGGGFLERKVNKKVVDHFKDNVEFSLVVRKMVKWIINKKAKHRMQTYRKVLEDAKGWNVIAPSYPNKT